MNILITGISRGLGFFITKALLEQGHTVFGISRTTSDELNQLKKEFDQSLNILHFDLEQTSEIKKVIFEEFIGKQPIHALINNAAKAYDTLLTNIDEQELMRMIKINQISPMILTKYSIRNMILHDIQGSIVHISSISVHTGFKGLSMYAATKGALEAFSKNTAREWGTKGIRSNCIAAGFMATEMTSTMSDEHREKVIKRSSLKKETDIDSVVSMCLHLISTQANSITGQTFLIDAGMI